MTLSGGGMDMSVSRHFWVSLIVVTILFAYGPRVFATPGPAAVYDARSLAMAGSGVAHVDNASAIFHNPAALEQIRKLSVTLAFSPGFPSVTSPFVNRNTGEATPRESSSGFVPWFFAGAAYRVLDRLVVGAGVYVNNGFGAEYKNVPELGGENIRILVGTAEVNVPISLRVSDRLSFGFGIRFGYIFQDSRLLVELPPPAPPGAARLDVDMSGIDGPGVMLGAFYRPMSALRLGVSFRTKLSLKMDGTSEVVGSGIESDSSSEFSIAHELRLGGAYSILQDRLLLVGELYVRMHNEANNELITETPPQPPVVTPLEWRTSVGGRLATEIGILKSVPLRAGYTIVRSGTPKDTAGPFFPPPGLLHAVSVGAGYKTSKFAIDAGFLWAWGNSVITQDDLGGSLVTRNQGSIGRYKSSLPTFSLSATYQP